MSTIPNDRPPLVVTDRRQVRRPPTVLGNREPWHPVTNPRGLAGQLFPGPVQS